jgi:hypothetical protein
MTTAVQQKTTAGMVSAEQQRRNRPRGKISDEKQRRNRPEGMITAEQQREQPTAWKISAEQQNGNTGTRQQKQETARKVTRLVMTMKRRQARWEGFPGRCTIKCWIENSNTSFAGQLCSNRCTELYSQQNTINHEQYKSMASDERSRKTHNEILHEAARTKLK